MRSLLVLFLVAFSLAAADHPNFSGTWKMDPDKSDFGPLPRPLTYQRTIEHKDPVIHMSVHQASNAGDRTVDINLRTDGQETANGGPAGEAKTTAKWAGRELDLTTTRPVEGGNVVLNESWDLSSDGHTLTSLTHMKTPRGNVEIKLVLDKQ